ncbi:MAG: Lrp/AsnC ligand binding domain-containing protein [Candidatus Bathyarchaeia archaeon]
MVVHAYVLFKVSSGSEREICKKMVDYDGVLESSIVYGEYDLIAKIKTENLNQLEGLIEKIRTIPSIVLTSTMIVARAYKGKTERNIRPKN